MPAPHPLAALHAAGPTYAEEAEQKLRALLQAHDGDVRAAAVALDPPVHEITVHEWLTRWGLRPWMAEQWPGRKVSKKAAAAARAVARRRKKSR